MKRTLHLLATIAAGMLVSGSVLAQGSSNTCAALSSIHTFPVGSSCNLLSFNKPTNFTADLPASGCGAGGNSDAWARFEATHTSTFVRYSTKHGNAVLSVFTGDCSALTQVACVNDVVGSADSGEEEKLILTTVVGQMYIVRLEHVGANTTLIGKLCVVAFDAPDNDECADAPAISSGSTPFSTYGATGTDITSCAAGDSKDVWFKYISDCTGATTVSTCGSADYNSALSVFSACGGSQIACNANGSGCAGGLSKLTFNSVTGSSYWIRVSGEGKGMGSGTLEISCEVRADNCSTASPIYNGVTAYRTTAATGSDMTSCGLNDSKDIWMVYTASCAGEVTIGNCGTAGFNTTLAAFSSCGGTQITCNDDAPGCGQASSITFSALPAERFIIRLAGVGATQGFGTLTTSCSPIIWYSRSSGTTDGSIWSRTPTGPAGPAVIDKYSSLVVQDGHTVSQTVPSLTVRGLQVATGGTYTVGGTAEVVLLGDLLVDGVFQANSGSLRLAGDRKQLISGDHASSFYNITQVNMAGTFLNADMDIRGSLDLVVGAFETNGHTVRMVSDASGTGRLGPVGIGASYSGDLTMERYIPAGATNWRLIGSAVRQATVNDWKDDFFTAGFPGAHSPNFSNPTGSGILWPSVRYYKESAPGSTMEDGLVGATSATQALAPGLGFAAWCGTGLTTTTAFTMDVSGPPNIATAPIALPMSWTNTGFPGADGWNLVSNPLPSPIRFNQLSLGADVENRVVYFDPRSGNNATYDLGLGTGINGGTNTIQSGQGFWLKANGPATTTTVSENAKTIGNGGGFFGADQVQVHNMVRMKISSNINQFSDETIVVFTAGSAGIDEEDVPKFVFSHPQAPQIATDVDGTVVLAINAYGAYSTDISIPVLVNVAVNGNYMITTTGLENTGLSCLRLEDLTTGTITPLTEGAVYAFAALADDDESQPRFLLHGSAPLLLTPVGATCHDRSDGSASVAVTTGPVNIVWEDGTGSILLSQENVQEEVVSIFGLEAGTYTIQATSNAGCGNLTATFNIEQPSAVEVEADAVPASCPLSEDGTIDLMVLGGAGPYTYLWSNGSTESAIEVPAGIYTVNVTDANGCSNMFEEYVVSAGEGPEAGISVASNSVMVDDVVHFHSASEFEMDHRWDFGDGTTSEVAEPEHLFEMPGSYMVTLSVNDGTCTSKDSVEIFVESTTGITTVVGQSLNAWVSGDQIYIDHNFNTNEPVLVRVLNTNGQVVQEHRFAGQPARLSLPTTELAEGIWLVRISSGQQVRSFALPVLH